MATVCTACGTENRDKARFCRGCARPIGSTTPAEPETPPRPRGHDRGSKSSSTPPGERAASAPGRWLGGALAVLLVTGLAAWALWPAGQPVAVVPLSAPVAEAVAVVPVSANALPNPLAVAPGPAPVAAPPPAPGALPDPAAARPGAPARAGAPATRPVAAPVPSRPAATSTTRNAPAEPVPASVPVSAEPAAPVAPAPARSRSVDETCADRSNFLSRDLCRIQACGNAALAGDPVCVRFREMEEANRRRGDN